MSHKIIPGACSHYDLPTKHPFTMSSRRFVLQQILLVNKQAIIFCMSLTHARFHHTNIHFKFSTNYTTILYQILKYEIWKLQYRQLLVSTKQSTASQLSVNVVIVLSRISRVVGTYNNRNSYPGSWDADKIFISPACFLLNQLINAKSPE